MGIVANAKRNPQDRRITIHALYHNRVVRDSVCHAFVLLSKSTM
jgi:hypothetical protein